jgi:thioredoxin reductase (NADPH)
VDAPGLSRPAADALFEIAVVGGGPAGLSAAVAGGRLNRRTVCFETGTPRTAHAPRYYNYLGFRDGISGEELLRLGREQARRWGGEIRDLEVTRVERLRGEGGARFALHTRSGAVRAAGVIFATGIFDQQPRCGNLYGEQGIHYCVICDGYETRGERVAVLGHGAAAPGMLRALRDFTFDLHLLLDGHPAELSPAELDELAGWGVRVHPERLERYRCSREGVFFATAEGKEIFFPHVFIALGSRPNTSMAEELGCRLDEQGFIVTDDVQATNVPFVYAAGDCDGGHKQVTQAMAEGEKAALELARALRETLGPAWGSRQADPEKPALEPHGREGGGERARQANAEEAPAHDPEAVVRDAGRKLEEAGAAGSEGGRSRGDGRSR